MHIINLKTERDGVHDITDTIRELLAKEGIENGICTVFTPHTTAGLGITSFWDTLGHQDIVDELNRIVPTRVDFLHQYDTPQDASGHVKSVLTRVSETIIVKDGELLLGSSQALYFLEFDGPRNRQYYVKFIADEKV